MTKEEPLPILLDEAFAMYDDDRLAQPARDTDPKTRYSFLPARKRRREIKENELIGNPIGDVKA